MNDDSLRESLSARWISKLKYSKATLSSIKNSTFLLIAGLNLYVKSGNLKLGNNFNVSFLFTLNFEYSYSSLFRYVVFADSIVIVSFGVSNSLLYITL